MDRKKELIKYKGLQIVPAEAAVIEVPIPRGSEVPRAYIVADPAHVTKEVFHEYISKRMAPYKQLRGGIVYVDELPKNAVSKLLRRELRESAKKELQQVSAKL